MTSGKAGARGRGRRWIGFALCASAFAASGLLSACSKGGETKGDNTSGGARASGGDGPRGGAGASSGGGSTGQGGHGNEGGGSTAGAAGNGPVTGGGKACKGVLASESAPLADGAAVAIKINFGSQGCTIAPDFAGSNYEAFPGWGADTSMSAFQKQAFSDAGLQLLRYPGGEPGSWTDLLMTGKCKNGDAPNWSAPHYAELWTFARSAGAHSLMLQTNPTPQWCADGAQDASGARAAELARDVARRGVRAVYEVGNEPDLGESYFSKNGGKDAYIAQFIAHAKAIHSAAPGTEVYGPVVCGLGANCAFPTTWDSGFIADFLAKTGNLASADGKGSVDGVSFHVYWHNEWSFSDLKEAKIDKYGFGRYWANTLMPYLRRLIAKYDSRDLPIAVSEISIGNGVPNDAGQTQNMFSVLGTLDTVGGMAVSGLRSVQWFDANAAGPADFWLITPTKARPIFYAFAAWAKMGNLVLEVTSNASHDSVAAYATKKSDGSLQVLLLNKTKSAHEVSIELDGYRAEGKAFKIDSVSPATAGSDSATSIVYNGAADPAPGALPAAKASRAESATPHYSLPAYSAAVLSFEP